MNVRDQSVTVVRSQILSNLLLNAGKYSEAGTQITLSATVEDQTLVLSVKDEGIGIAAESLHHIFEMFSRVNGRTGMEEDGLGIGLALAKGLTELDGGTIEARSAGLGQGSEFLFVCRLLRRHHRRLKCWPMQR
jgi:signal transduction histidine kinase